MQQFVIMNNRYSISYKKNEFTFAIRLANVDDIPAIMLLNKKWTVTSLETAEKENGFLYCDNFSHDDLHKMVTHNEVALALYRRVVVGYYINDNHSRLLGDYISAISFLKDRKIISKTSKVSMRTQIVVEKEFQRMGLPNAMLHFLKPYLSIKYDLLFSIGLNQNPKKLAHQKAGWQIIFENEIIYYCIYDLKI